MASSARIEELKEKFDENPRRYFAPLANELRKQGDLAQAISICRAHLPNQPGHLSGHIVLAQALYEATDFEDSRAEFQAALAIDPENLIALRFMGDLSNASGDVESARGWYQRVLDAEPRNYEIARIMRELNAPPNEDAGLQNHVARPAHATPVVSPTVASKPDIASFAPPAPQQQARILSHEAPAELPRESAPASAVTAHSPLSPSDGDGGVRDTPLVIELPDDGHPGPNSEANRPAAGSLDTQWDAEAASASELSDLEAAPEDWFTDPVDPAEGLAEDYEDDEEYSESTLDVAPVGADHDIESLFATQSRQPPEMPAQTELDTSAESPSSQLQSDIAIDFDEVKEALGAEPQPAPPTASYEMGPKSGDLATATDVPATPVDDSSRQENDLGPPKDGSAERTFATPRDVDIVTDSSTRAAEAPESFADRPSRDDTASATETQWWEAFVPSPLAETQRTEPADEALGQMPQSINALPIEPSLPASETRIARTPEYVETVPESNAAPFVTETLAELYLQQGFHEEALSIYRQLLQRNPSDDTLRERVTAIESGSGSYARDVSAPSHGEHHQVSPTQSVRTFFGRLAKRTPRRRASVSGSGPLRRTGEFPAQPVAKDIDGGDVLLGAIPNASLDRESPGGATDSPEHSSSLTRLFNAPALSREDQDAAAALAAAFNSPAANVGRPSRVAEQELSLDHLFRDPASSVPAPVSLDDFYAAPRGGTSDPSTTESEPPDERAADIRQFTSWLEGLKKK